MAKYEVFVPTNATVVKQLRGEMLTPSEEQFVDARRALEIAETKKIERQISEEEYSNALAAFLSAKENWIKTDFGDEAFETMVRQEEALRRRAASPWGIDREELTDGMYDLRGCGQLRKSGNVYIIFSAPFGDTIDLDTSNPEFEGILTRMLPDLRRLPE